jgi:pyridoxal phosphate enzyme (YggS family)
MIAENLNILRSRITQTCLRCGRRPEDILLVAVSKTFPAEMIQRALAEGQIDFGENYVQELKAKRDALKGRNIRWHFIGHLQSNKVKHVAEYAHLIHSVDSIALGREIDRQAGRCGRRQDVLVEVRTTDESTKFGVLPEHTLALVRELAQFPHLRVCGLMTMGPFSSEPDDSRPSFRMLQQVRQEIIAAGIEDVSMSLLSMGMTHDFEVAIEEGATILRIGTAIFGNRKTIAEVIP